MNKQELLSVPRKLSLLQLSEQPDPTTPWEKESRQAHNSTLKETFPVSADATSQYSHTIKNSSSFFQRQSDRGQGLFIPLYSFFHAVLKQAYSIVNITYIITALLLKLINKARLQCYAKILNYIRMFKSTSASLSLSLSNLF